MRLPEPAVADRLVAADPLEAQVVVVDSLGPEVPVYSAAVAGQVDTAVWEPPAAISPDQAPAWALVRPADPRLRLQDVAARMQLQKLAITGAF
jgi:hypothetical protein